MEDEETINEESILVGVGNAYMNHKPLSRRKPAMENRLGLMASLPQVGRLATPHQERWEAVGVVRVNLPL